MVEGEDLERTCQGVSPGDAVCNYPATVHCPTCDGWFCDAHAEDEQWHSCMLPPPGDVGGEAELSVASAPVYGASVA
jgi:hypothetical protein